jgi:hypothetical protein
VRLLVSGIVKLSMPARNRDLLLGIRTSGSVLGGVPAVLGGDQIVTATAVTRCETRTMSVSHYLRYIVRGGDPEVSEWLARQNAWEIREQRPSNGFLRRAANIMFSDSNRRGRAVMGTFTRSKFASPGSRGFVSPHAGATSCRQLEPHRPDRLESLRSSDPL